MMMIESQIDEWSGVLKYFIGTNLRLFCVCMRARARVHVFVCVCLSQS